MWALHAYWPIPLRDGTRNCALVGGEDANSDVLGRFQTEEPCRYPHHQPSLVLTDNNEEKMGVGGKSGEDDTSSEAEGQRGVAERSNRWFYVTVFFVSLSHLKPAARTPTYSSSHPLVNAVHSSHRRLTSGQYLRQHSDSPFCLASAAFGSYF